MVRMSGRTLPLLWLQSVQKGKHTYSTCDPFILGDCDACIMILVTSKNTVWLSAGVLIHLHCWPFLSHFSWTLRVKSMFVNYLTSWTELAAPKILFRLGFKLVPPWSLTPVPLFMPHVNPCILIWFGLVPCFEFIWHLRSGIHSLMKWLAFLFSWGLVGGYYHSFISWWTKPPRLPAPPPEKDSNPNERSRTLRGREKGLS